MNNQNAANNHSLKEMLRARVEKWEASDNAILHWLPSILGIAGLIVEWNFSVYIGLACCIGGFMYGFNSDMNANKVITAVTNVLGILMFLGWVALQ